MAKEAAKATCKWDLIHPSNREEVGHTSSAELYRLVQFVLTRERDGLSRIRAELDPLFLEDFVDCSHNEEDAQDYYFHLMKAVEEEFVNNPCVGANDLLAVLDMVPDPPLCCDPLPKSADYYSGGSDGDTFDCPTRPMTIRRRLFDIADDMRLLNHRLLNQFFGEGFESG